MSFISDIQWKGLQTFDEIETWFCLPMHEYLEMFNEQFVEPDTVLFENYKIDPSESRACFFYYEMRSKLDDLSKLLHRLMDEYREASKKNGDKKDDLLKNLAEISGVDPEDIEGNRKYSAKQLEQIKSFWLYIHKDRDKKSKHAETIRVLLELAANEEGGCHAD